MYLNFITYIILYCSSSNCGTCGNLCDSGQSCINGACVLSCPSGQTDCYNGKCNSLKTEYVLHMCMCIKYVLKFYYVYYIIAHLTVVLVETYVPVGNHA